MDGSNIEFCVSKDNEIYMGEYVETFRRFLEATFEYKIKKETISSLWEGV